MQPNCTSLEMVERWVTLKNGKRTLQDHVRLEVALLDGKEMLSWPVLSMLAEEQITGSNVTRLDFSVPAEYSGLTGPRKARDTTTGYISIGPFRSTAHWGYC